MRKALSEHIVYLTLPGRDALYRSAIDAVIKPGDTVVDLGCGVGVLGLYCLEAGAAHCWGIDSSEAIYLAREAMDRAGLAQSYTTIPEATFRTDIPDKVDVIICDHVGFMGFDYGIVRLIRDARQRFLKPGGAMIPRALDLMVAAVSSDACRDRTVRWGSELVPPQYRWLEFLDRNVRHAHDFTPAELLGESSWLGHIDLSDDEPEFFRFDTVLPVARAGRFDGFAGWFDCRLAGDVRMTNSPLDPVSIRRSQAFFPAHESFFVNAGDEIGVSLRFRADDDMIMWTIKPPGGAKTHKLSTFHSTALTPTDLAKDPAKPLVLSRDGEARALVLGLVDGKRSSEAILAAVVSERPDLFPTEQALCDFVKTVLLFNCSV